MKAVDAAGNLSGGLRAPSPPPPATRRRPPAGRRSAVIRARTASTSCSPPGSTTATVQQPRRQPARQVRQRRQQRPHVPRRLQGPGRQARLHQGPRLLRRLDHPGGAQPLRLRLPRLPRLGLLRVDPRLETPGASYQDLINAAHAKGIKIYQDVVYNHSSRWGATGLYVPTVYGVRDAQWDVVCTARRRRRHNTTPTSTPENSPRAGAYNGDLWSTTAPAGNQCPRLGHCPPATYSPEGYTLHDCQWPSPDQQDCSPPTLYHQCWIGNWEGEDSRTCWLHEDLADFNTENATVQQYLIDAYNKYIDMGVDGFRVDTAVHIPRVTWNRRFLPAIQQHVAGQARRRRAEGLLRLRRGRRVRQRQVEPRLGQPLRAVLHLEGAQGVRRRRRAGRHGAVRLRAAARHRRASPPPPTPSCAATPTTRRTTASSPA